MSSNKVLVIGGGPAGLESARSVAELGVILAVWGAAETFAFFEQNDFPAEFSD